MPAKIERKFFLCTGQVVGEGDLAVHAGSHVVGELRRVWDEGRRVTALSIYVRAREVEEVPAVEAERLVDVIGDAQNIRCGFEGCGRLQRWEIGRAAVLALMGRMGLQDEFLRLEREDDEIRKRAATLGSVSS